MTTKEKVIQHLIDLKLVSNIYDGDRWLKKEKISSLGGKTAAELLVEGHLDAVLQYIDRISEGGYA